MNDLESVWDQESIKWMLAPTLFHLFTYSFIHSLNQLYSVESGIQKQIILSNVNN